MSSSAWRGAAAKRSTPSARGLFLFPGPAEARARGASPSMAVHHSVDSPPLDGARPALPPPRRDSASRPRAPAVHADQLFYLY